MTADRYDLPVATHPTGPRVRALLRRSGTVAAGVAATATLAARRARTPGGRARSLGVLAPGAGYAYSRNPGRLLATLPAFGAAFVAWFGSGNILAPAAVWAATALDAGRQAERRGAGRDAATTLVPLAVAGAAVGARAAARRSFRAAQRRAEARRAHLATVPRREVTTPAPSELSAEELGHLRRLLDTALQPHDSFDGYDIVEQFQPAAIRYQINFSQWALALAHAHHTPAFAGYSAQAQRQLISKITHPRVFGYWRWEQTWGNLSLDWDPITNDNIMLSGYLALMLGAYEGVTGDDRYREPGCLRFEISGQRWDHDHDSIAAAIARNMDRAPMVLFPCEPNWVYSQCNLIGFNALLAGDRLHDSTAAADLQDRYLEALHADWVTPDGHIHTIRSNIFGITLPGLTSTAGDCSAVGLMHPVDPDLARRTWELLRFDTITIDDDGRLQVATTGVDAIDTGTYRPNDAMIYAWVLWAASEVGDTEVARLAAEELDERAPVTDDAGRRSNAGLSYFANIIATIGRINPPGGLHALVRAGAAIPTYTGPRLEHVDYPDVLVARAVTDGEGLHLVLRPGQGAVTTRVQLAGLEPGRRYVTKGAADNEVLADDGGQAWVGVEVAERTELEVSPA